MTTALFLFFVAIFAVSEAWRDAKAIARYEDIDHGKGLLFRLAICGIFFGCASALHWIVAHDFRFLLFAPMGWAAFTMLFRFALNAGRGLDWRYVSPSNWYDWQFLRLTTFGQMQRGEWIDSWSVWSLTDSARRAGAYAYAFEATVLLASAITFFALR